MRLTFRIPFTTLRYTFNQWAKFYALCALLSFTLMFAVACTTAWTTEATNIVNLIVSAIPTLMSLLAMAGVGLAPDVGSTIQKWASEATSDLQNVVLPLIAQYQSATSDIQRNGILAKLDAAVTLINQNLQTILPTLHVTNPQTQAAIEGLIAPIANEIAALVNFIPVLKGGVADHDEARKRAMAVLTPKQFHTAWEQAQQQFRDRMAGINQAGHTDTQQEQPSKKSKAQ